MHIIGAGRVGGALTQAARSAGQDVTLLDRTADWSVLGGGTGPILVATRNDDLDAVVERVPATRRQDMTFVQNGMLRPWLAERGLAAATRGLLFFAVAKRGAPIQPGPPSPFVGPHADAVVAVLKASGVPAETVTTQAFTDLEHEKLLWNSAFGLMCQAHDVTVGEVVDAHRSELEDLVAELHTVATQELNVSVELDELMYKLCAYSKSISDYRGAVKEWRWRNGWYVAVAHEHGVPMPVHAALCQQAGVEG